MTAKNTDTFRNEEGSRLVLTSKCPGTSAQSQVSTYLFHKDGSRLVLTSIRVAVHQLSRKSLHVSLHQILCSISSISSSEVLLMLSKQISTTRYQIRPVLGGSSAFAGEMSTIPDYHESALCASMYINCKIK
jgi:hypothetical protein